MKDRLQNKGLVLALATLCCLLWGSAYPAVKIGYVLFDIDTTGAQVLFAGYRFSLAGIITWLITSLYYQKIVVPRGDEWGRMVSPERKMTSVTGLWISGIINSDA